MWRSGGCAPLHLSDQAARHEPGLKLRAPIRLKETTDVVEHIRYAIDPSRNDDSDEAYLCAGALLDASPHCQHWEAARSVDEPGKQIVRIEWDSAEGHLQGFRQSAEFKPFLEDVQPFYNDIEEMTHYQVTANGTGVSR
jgi:hypothetical protein